jgi:hypothetical protein
VNQQTRKLLIKNQTTTMAPKERKKEQVAHQRAAVPKKVDVQGSKGMEPKVSLQGDNDNKSTSRL